MTEKISLKELILCSIILVVMTGIILYIPIAGFGEKSVVIYILMVATYLYSLSRFILMVDTYLKNSRGDK